jgi:uncharacterized protein with ATP-grasp and redox domains
MHLLPELQGRIDASDDPFGLAVKLAIAGNIIDLGARGQVAEDDLRASVDKALKEPVHGLVEDLSRDIVLADHILYLADNCGEIVEVIDNGSDAPGTLLEDCSPEFRRRFDEADLIVAKGQGNHGSLNDVPAPIYFLFKVKCAVVSRSSARSS